MNGILHQLKRHRPEEETVSEMARILFVDDDEFLLNILKQSLIQYDGRWAMEFTTDPAEALELIEDTDYDVLVTDVKMPKISGFELFERTRIVSPDTSVILMTGLPDIDAAVQAMKCGAAEYLRKPFDAKDVERTIVSTLEERETRLAGDTWRAIMSARTIAGYEIVRKLDEGSMGSVYLVQRKVDGEMQKFALKALKTSLLGKEERAAAVERFRLEAKAAQRLQHPNIIRLYEFDFLVRGRVPYMVMEYFDGISLDRIIAGGDDDELSYRDKAWILRQTASALEEVHKHFSCHRDIKPGNIMINPDLDVRLIDFGIAKLPESELTNTNCIMGTPAYISPEAVTDDGNIDYRSDFFSLGVMAYELLLGKRPFLGTNIITLARQITEMEPPLPTEVDPQMPHELAAIVQELMAKKPLDRFDSASDIVNALDAFLVENDPSE